MTAYKETLANLDRTTETKPGATLNNGGDSAQNPIISGFAMRIKVSKHDSSDTLQSFRIVASDGRQKDLTSRAAESGESVTLDIIHGIDTYADDPPTRNRIIVSMSDSGVREIDIWVASRPTVEVTLNGYSGHEYAAPFVKAWR